MKVFLSKCEALLCLAVFLLLVALSRPASAQSGSGGYGGYGGYSSTPQWVLTKREAKGTTNFPDGSSVLWENENGGPGTASGGYGWSKYVGAGTYTRTASGTVTLTLQWMANGQPAPNPPQTAYFKETIAAWWSASSDAGESGTGQCSNGISSLSTNNRVEDVRLVQRNGSSGTVTLTSPNLSAKSQITTNGTKIYLVTGVQYTVAPDTRGVRITSGQSFWCAGAYPYGSDQPHARKPNTVSSNGTESHDTVKPPRNGNDPAQQGFTRTYSGLVLGTGWSPDSPYEWRSSKAGTSLSGRLNESLFGSLGIREFMVWYHGGMEFAGSGGTDHITLKVRDSNAEGAVAQADCFLTFHDPVEHWDRDSQSPRQHPYPSQPSPANFGDWQSCGFEDNPSDFDQSKQYLVSGGGSQTVEGTIGQSAELGLSGEVVSLTFQQNESITVGQTVERQTQIQIPWTKPPHTRSYLYWGWKWQERWRQCCPFSTEGHMGRRSWRATVPIKAPGGMLQDINAYPYIETLR